MAPSLAMVGAVLRLPTLRRLVPALLAFSITEWASWIGLVVFAFSRGGPVEAGIVAGLVFVPSIVVAPAASFFGDRWPRARVLAIAYACVAAAMGSTAVALAIAPPLVAYLLATIAATSITLVRPAHAALLPEIVETPDELAVANAASGTAEGLGALLGPLLAGVVVAVAGAPAVYGAIALLAGGALIAVLPMARHAGGTGAGAGAGAVAVARAPVRPTGLLRDLGAGIRTVLSDRRLFAVMAVLSGSIALLGAFNVLLSVIAVELLGGDESLIGYLAAAAGLGSVVGAGATGLVMGRERLAAWYVGAGALFAGAVALIGLVPVPWIIVVCVIATGVGWAFVYVQALTMAQRQAGDDVMSRVFGIMESTMMASQSLGALAVPVLIGWVGSMSSIVVCGVTVGVVTVLAAPTLIGADRIDPHRIRRLRALRGVPMFGPLAAPVLERLAAASMVVAAEPGRRIIEAGEVGDRFYVVLAGEVEVQTPGGGHRREGPGESFGEIALLQDVPRTATVTALTGVELLGLDRGPFLEALTGQPRSRALAEAQSLRRLEADALVAGPVEPT